MEDKLLGSIFEWLQKHFSSAEQRDPALAVLKQAVRGATTRLNCASAQDKASAVKAQDKANAELVHYVSSHEIKKP